MSAIYVQVRNGSICFFFVGDLNWSRIRWSPICPVSSFDFLQYVPEVARPRAWPADVIAFFSADLL